MEEHCVDIPNTPKSSMYGGDINFEAKYQILLHCFSCQKQTNKKHLPLTVAFHGVQKYAHQCRQKLRLVTIHARLSPTLLQTRLGWVVEGWDRGEENNKQEAVSHNYNKRHTLDNATHLLLCYAMLC